MKLKILFYLMVITAAVTMSGCASKPKLNGKGRLCGVVIDENNEPVPDFIISCRKDKGLWKCTMTGSEGLFVFEDMPLGIYSFKGTKECYLDFYEEDYVFNDRSKVFCFQLSSIDNALDKTEQMIIYGDYEQAVTLLDQIKCEKNLEAKKVLAYYRDYLTEKMGE